MPGKAKKHPEWSLLVVAVLILAVGVALVPLAQGPVTCSSGEMRPGDSCVRDGATSTYEEEKRAQERIPILFGIVAALVALASVVLGLAREAPDPQPDRQAWETAYAQWRARYIEQRLAITPPEKREGMRRALEQGAAQGAAKYRKWRGWTGSG